MEDCCLYVVKSPKEDSVPFTGTLKCPKMNTVHESKILRLRGGVAFKDEEKRPLKSPLQECKPIMDKFDEILTAYKSSLGPCGEATCPYSQNMMKENCKKKCHPDQVVKEEQSKDECKTDPCDNEECPFKEKRKRFEPGCGSANCAYTKYKLGLVDQDASLEYMMLPPAVSGKCGSPNCDYPLGPDLPPIHWDCPEPLPKGVCKNPNCPLQPSDLRRIKIPLSKKKFCSCQDCPYAFPPPCGLPSCPFRENPCPFLEKQKESTDSCSCASEEEDLNEEVCSNPSCPFTPGVQRTTNGEDTKLKGKFEACDSPHCPFAKNRPKKKNKTQVQKYEQLCVNPYCPFIEKSKGENTKKAENCCTNPNCPHAKNANSCSWTKALEQKRGESGDQLNCSNPQCPFTKDTRKNKRLFKSSDENCPKISFCGNPNCSYHNRRSLEQESEESFEANDDCESSEEKCDNPDCSFVKGNRLGKITDDRKGKISMRNELGNEKSNERPSEDCGNPNCPYTKRISNTNEEEEDSLCYYPDSNEVNETGIKNCNETEAVVVENKTTVRNGGHNNKPQKRVENQNIKTERTTPQKKKNRGKFVYSMGNIYPGVKIGHKECISQVFNVPPKMGWLWNIPPPIVRLKPRRGWKPGALTKGMAAKIRAHRQAKGLGMLRVPKFGESRDINDSSCRDLKVIPKPTLYVQKKDGAYSIIMNPLKDPNGLVDNEDPYMECTPMRFKISPNRPKKTGSQTCFCDDEEQENSSSSESELDIEFTPPAGIIHPERFKRKMNVIHCETQYNPLDIEKPKAEKNDRGDKKGGKDKGGKGEKDAKKGKGGKGGKDEKGKGGKGDEKTKKTKK